MQVKFTASRRPDRRIVRSAMYFPTLKRGHRRENCGVKECSGGHFENPMEQAREFWEAYDG